MATFADRRVALDPTRTESLSPGRSSGRFRWEGISLACGGAAFLAKAVFDYTAGEPPAAGAELVRWASDEKFALSMSNELLIIASVLLIPGLIGLYASLRDAGRRGVAIGCGIIAAAIPVMMVVSISQGRLVFPVYDMEIKDPAVVQLVAALYYGGEHAVVLILGVPTVLLSLAMRDTRYGRVVVYLGMITGVADFIGSYPWLIGIQLTLVTGLLFAAWFMAVGVQLARLIRV